MEKLTSVSISINILQTKSKRTSSHLKFSSEVEFISKKKNI